MNGESGYFRSTMAWPSKDPTDYHRQQRRPPRWLRWLGSDSGVPYHHHFAAGAGGVIAGLAILDDPLAALGLGLLAQAILELTGRRPTDD
jgi:hypothetical protein